MVDLLLFDYFVQVVQQHVEYGLDSSNACLVHVHGLTRLFPFVGYCRPKDRDRSMNVELPTNPTVTSTICGCVPVPRCLESCENGGTYTWSLMHWRIR